MCIGKCLRRVCSRARTKKHHSDRKESGGDDGGRGVLNSMIDRFPFEAHVPGGYKYCGPGTKLDKRLARGDLPKNELDAACRMHDIVYDQTTMSDVRKRADLQLADRAWRRVKADDASLGERAAAFAVANAMELKTKL